METIGSQSTNDADGLQIKDILETTSKQRQIINRRKAMRRYLVILVYSRTKKHFWQTLEPEPKDQNTWILK
jgi:hypothetical protein